jgi:hypothetical protein
MFSATHAAADSQLELGGIGVGDPSVAPGLSVACRARSGASTMACLIRVSILGSVCGLDHEAPFGIVTCCRQHVGKIGRPSQVEAMLASVDCDPRGGM